MPNKASVSPNHNNDQSKWNLLIEIGTQQLNAQNVVFDTIDRKTTRIFGFISLTEGYLTTKYFIGQSYHSLTPNNTLLIITLLVGLTTLRYCLKILSAKVFHIGANAKSISEDYWDKKNSTIDLQQEYIGCLNGSTHNNKETLNTKTKNFKLITNLIIAYYTLIALFILTTKFLCQ